MNISDTSQLTDHMFASSLPSIYEKRKEWTADGKLIQRPNRREEWKCDKSAKKAWKHEMEKGLSTVRKNGGGGGWIEKSARRAGGGETKTCGAKAGDTRRPASECTEKDRKEAANSFRVSLEGARQKRGRRRAEQKQSGDFQKKTCVAKNQ